MAWLHADTISFYQHLAIIPSFAESTQSRLHSDVPSDWWIVVADVIGSTKAIETGAYKNVNTVGVACIAAVINVDRNIDLPFIFGGDGATFAIPNVLCEPVIAALRAAQKLARESFKLELRVGLIQVKTLIKENFWVKCGKVRLSQHLTQAVFSGRGWEEAERRVKAQCTNGFTNGVIKVDEFAGEINGSFDGFECRWQNVPSFQDHKLSLLVAAITNEVEVNFATYQRVLATIQAIYGDVTQYHPLRESNMQLSFNPRLLSHEWRVRSAHLNLKKRIRYFANLFFLGAAGRFIFWRKLDTKAVKWSGYKAELIENSDFRKFDGMLRMVIDGKNSQATALQVYLEAEYRQGKLVFGLYKSREALLTCIVESYSGNHLHFVDGSDGGYALAAKELKNRMSLAKSAF